MFVDRALKLIIGSKNERELKKLQPRVVAINALESPEHWVPGRRRKL